MKTFYASIDYARLLLVQNEFKDSQDGDFDSIFEDEEFVVFSNHLYDQKNNKLASKANMDEAIFDEGWVIPSGMFVASRKGSVDYLIELEDDEADPIIDEISDEFPVTFRGKMLDCIEDSQEAEYEIVKDLS